MTDDYLIYTFTLNYNPQPLGGVPVVRTSKAAVIVECHYPRYVDQLQVWQTNKHANVNMQIKDLVLCKFCIGRLNLL